MAFEGWEEYSEHARAMNERLGGLGRLVEE